MKTPGISGSAGGESEARKTSSPGLRGRLAAGKRTGTRFLGSRPSRQRAANRQQAPDPGRSGPLQTAGFRRGGRRRAGCTHRRADRPAARSPGENGGAGWEGDASVDCGNGGIRLGLAPTWASRLPLAQQRSLGRTTVRTGTATARALILFCLFPPDLPRAHTPPPNLKDSVGPENAPSPPPPCARERGSLQFSREVFPPSLSSASSECANEKGGGRSRRKHCRRHYSLFLCCCNLDVLPTSRFFAAYR